MQYLSCPGPAPRFTRRWRPSSFVACCAMLGLTMSAPAPARPFDIERLLMLPLERLLALSVACAPAVRSTPPNPAAPPTSSHARSAR